MPARRSGRFPLRCGLALDDAHDVTLLHDQKVLTIELHLSARPLSKQDAVAGLDIERHELAGFVTCAGTDRDDAFTFSNLAQTIGPLNPDGTIGPKTGVASGLAGAAGLARRARSAAKNVEGAGKLYSPLRKWR